MSNEPTFPGGPPPVETPEDETSDRDTNTDSTDTEDETDSFREEQRTEAQSQNLSADNAVPEQRPQAFQEVQDTTSPLTKRLIEEGAIPDPDAPPMPQEAYDAADDDDRKAETAEQGSKPAAHVGTVIKVLSGPHRDRMAAVVRVVSYPSDEDRLKKMVGDEGSDYVHPKEVEVSFRGDARDGERGVLDLEEIDYELVPTGFAGRPAISGSL